MWKLTPFYSYRTNTATTSNFIMKFLFIYCVQVLWKNLHIQYCWNQTSSRLQCQHNLPKVPAHYVTLTSSTVWLLDSNILLYTYVRKKQIYSIRLKWNNFRLIGCIICFSCMVPVWQYRIYSQHSNPIFPSSATCYACIHVMHPYITNFIYSVFHFLSTPLCTEKMVSDSQSVAESCYMTSALSTD